MEKINPYVHPEAPAVTPPPPAQNIADKDPRKEPPVSEIDPRDKIEEPTKKVPSPDENIGRNFDSYG
jgi:hypothetical protein